MASCYQDSTSRVSTMLLALIACCSLMLNIHPPTCLRLLERGQWVGWKAWRYLIRDLDLPFVDESVSSLPISMWLVWPLWERYLPCHLTQSVLALLACYVHTNRWARAIRSLWSRPSRRRGREAKGTPTDNSARPSRRLHPLHGNHTSMYVPIPRLQALTLSSY